ncbi:hypothetical protein ACFLWC_00385 [Chloroflexota bacterium]
MKRVDLSPEQLEEVIRHRQGGQSWLAVQNATGISRRVAQRAYEQWQRARSIRELENVRVKVGEIEFGGHLDMLTRLAEYLIEHLTIPEYPSFSRDAGAHFTLLMEREIIVIRQEALYMQEALSKANPDRIKARNVRRNRLLLESLKEHTADKFRWDLLDSWMQGWDTCYRVFPGVRNLIGEVIGNTFRPFPGLNEWFVINNKDRKAVDILEEGIQDVLWKGIVAGEVETATGMVYGKSIDLMEVEVLQIAIGARTLVQKENREMAPSFVDLCHGIIKELWGAGRVKEVRKAVEKMQSVIEEMEAVLEPLVLRPQILHTRCQLCPA